MSKQGRQWVRIPHGKPSGWKTEHGRVWLTSLHLCRSVGYYLYLLKLRAPAGNAGVVVAVESSQRRGRPALPASESGCPTLQPSCPCLSQPWWQLNSANLPGHHELQQKLMFAQGFKPTSSRSASYPLLSTVHALSVQMAWIQHCPTTNGDFPLAGATGVWVSGANRVEVNSYALLRRSSWSQLGRCSQQEDLLQYRNPPLLTPAFPICRLIVL